MRNFTCLIVLILLATSPAAGQSANNLMDRFAAAWTQDDAELVTSMLADDVVLVGDGEVVEGFDAVDDWRTRQMEATGRLTITTVKSDRFDNVAYHTGQWALDFGEDTSGGSHTFVFERMEDDTWKIVSMTISSDPDEDDEGASR